MQFFMVIILIVVIFFTAAGIVYCWLTLDRVTDAPDFLLPTTDTATSQDRSATPASIDPSSETRIQISDPPMSQSLWLQDGDTSHMPPPPPSYAEAIARTPADVVIQSTATRS